MATELEQFVDANKNRLAEVNASNPPLYSAISLALDYLNKNYFGGTSEIKVELPSVAPQITQTPSVNVTFELRLFTKQEIKDLIQKNRWGQDTLSMTKIKVNNEIESKNFQQLAFQLGYTYNGGANYIEFEQSNIGAIFCESDYTLEYNFSQDTFNTYTEYKTLDYNTLFSDLLPQPNTTTETTPTFWDKAFCSKDWATKIDYDYLLKAMYSKRRSQDMKVEIARAFGEICVVEKGTQAYSEAIDYYESLNSPPPTTNYIYRYQIDEKVKEILTKNGFADFDIVQFSNNQINTWVNETAWVMFEQPLKIERIIDEFIYYYNDKIGKTSTQQTTLTRGTPLTPPQEVQTQPTQQPSASNFKFKVGEQVKITDKDFYFPSYTQAFKDLNFRDTSYKDFQGDVGDIAWIEATYLTNKGRNAYKIQMITGKDQYKEFLFEEKGLELAQTPQIEVGDWVEIIDVSLLHNIPINSVGRVSQFDASGDPFIKWVNISGVDGFYSLSRFKLVKKESEALFKIGDLIKTKDDYTFSDVKKGAYAVVTGLDLVDSNIQVKFDWIDTPANKKLVGKNKMSDEWWEGYFELALSNEKQEEIAKNVVDKLKTQSTSPVGFVKPDDTTQNNNEEDFEDLANQLEDLDF